MGIYLIDNGITTDIRWYEKQDIAIKDIRKNRKYYLESV